MSDEMIDRVAKAIKDCGAYTPDWQGTDEDLIIMARAAIAAMREPTEGMVLKGLDALYKDVYPGDSVNMAEAYTAMIDAALNSKS